MGCDLTTVACACGARFEREEVALPIKDIGIFECTACGQVLERWHGRAVPRFKLISVPQRKATYAA